MNSLKLFIILCFMFSSQISKAYEETLEAYPLINLDNFDVPHPTQDESTLPTYENFHEFHQNDEAYHAESYKREELLPEYLFPFNPFIFSDPSKNKFHELLSGWVEKARDLSLDILFQARKGTPKLKSKAIYYLVHRKIKSAEILWPKKGYEFKACKEVTLAYTIGIDSRVHSHFLDSTIFLCSKVSENRRVWTLEKLAQILIHEGAHNVGYLDECKATKIEVAAMRLSTLGLQFKNGYYKKCNL